MSFFQDLFCSCDNIDTSVLEEVAFPSISVDGVQQLIHPVTKDEVFYALQGMKIFYSPGVDGFHAFFFKKYWHVVGDEVGRLVRDAFVHGFFDPSLAETLIALIPKGDELVRMRDFRPISLCNVLYKLITKV